MRYYAACNVGGPISLALDGDTEAEALASFGAVDTRAAVDGASTDLEDALDLDGAGMDDAAFTSAVEAAGARYVRSLSPVVNAQAGRIYHLHNGWSLYAVALPLAGARQSEAV